MNKDIDDHLNALSRGCLEYFFGRKFFHRLSIGKIGLCCEYVLSKNLVGQKSCRTPRIYRDEFQNEHTKSNEIMQLDFYYVLYIERNEKHTVPVFLLGNFFMVHSNGQKLNS